jgi:hypothetical protein
METLLKLNGNPLERLAMVRRVGFWRIGFSTSVGLYGVLRYRTRFSSFNA